MKRRILLIIFLAALSFNIFNSITEFWIFNNTIFRVILDIKFPIPDYDPGVGGQSEFSVGDLLFNIVFGFQIILAALLIVKYGNFDSHHKKRLVRLFYVSIILIVIYRILTFYYAIPEAPSIVNAFIVYSGILYVVLDAYVGLSLVYIGIEHFKTFKHYLYDRPLKRIRIAVTKQSNTLNDLFHFLGLSILITFLADVVFNTIQGESIFSVIPLMSDISSVFGATYSPTIGDLTSKLGQFVGPPLGVFIAFLLRQFRYREVANSREKHPGVRVLYLFLVAVPLILILDAFSIYQENQTSAGPITKSDSKDSVPQKPRHVLPYAMESTFRTVSMPWIYTISIVTWILDWFIFSELWKLKKEKHHLPLLDRDPI